MKKTDWIFPSSVLIYSILFWKQMPGLNFLLFTPILLLGQVLMNGEVIRNRAWILAAIGAMCCSFCVMNYGNALSIFGTFFSLLLASYFAHVPKGSVIVGFVSSLLSIFISFFFMISDGVNRRNQKTESDSGNKSWKRFLIVLVVLIVVMIFFFMYRESSVMFYNLTKNLNLDFISLAWIAFTIFGALVVYGFYYNGFFPFVSEADGNRALELSADKQPTWLDKLMSMETEQFSGIVLFSLLNILLLVVNTLDATFIFGGSGKLPQGVSCTQYVHQGVGMLITSIVFAILIILYYFRGRMNFSANGKWLRMLAVIWIVQNAFMLYSTFWRNDVYIMVFGLTNKRIGVFIYLLLTLIGLFVTAWKVYGKKTNAFLIRTNAWLFYAVWVSCSFVNWDKMIFDNNIYISKSPDIAYLNSLSGNILADLFHYQQKHPEISKIAYQDGNVSSNLSSRIFAFLSDQKYLREEMKWPSYELNANRNYNELKDQNNFGADIVYLPHFEMKHIYFFKGYRQITSLNLANNDLVDLGEIGEYKNLISLTLTENRDLISLSGIEKLQNLQYLALDGTAVKDYSPLLKLKNLETLYVNQNGAEWAVQLCKANPKLTIRNQY